MTLEFTAITPLILVLIVPATVPVSLPEALTLVPRLEWFPLHFGLHYLNKSSPVSCSWLNSTQEFCMSTKLPDITRTRREFVGRQVLNPSGGDLEPFVGARFWFRAIGRGSVRVGEEVLYGWAITGQPNTLSFFPYHHPVLFEQLLPTTLHTLFRTLLQH
jgi:hypothetical protein